MTKKILSLLIVLWLTLGSLGCVVSQTLTPTAPAAATEETTQPTPTPGAPVVIGLARRLGGGKHAGHLYPPIFPDRSKPEQEETRRILCEYTRILEGFIRRYPDQWFWMHRRWKTRPEGEGS